MRKRRLALAGAMVLLALCPAAGRDAAAQAPQASRASQASLELQIPFQAIGIGLTPLWTAIENGLFRKYGIEASTTFISQSPTLVAAMLSGDTPFAISGQDAVINADLNGGDIAILASGPEKLVFTIYAARDLHSVADLKGKDIGISQFGATTDFITRYVLKQAGMEARRDADIIPMGTQANNLAALQAGTIHAAVLAPPTTLKAKKLGFNPVADMADYDLLFYTSALLAKRSWVAAHPGDALNVVRGYVAGVAMVHNNRQAAEAALGKYSDTSDKELLDASYEALVKVLPRNPIPQEAALQTGLDENANPAAKTADPKSFIDASFLARLQREGFIDALYKGAE
jgi:ABC-type nitrate/sulfonate/bicarbonate transport system substrate-binding protein